MEGIFQSFVFVTLFLLTITLVTSAINASQKLLTDLHKISSVGKYFKRS